MPEPAIIVHGGAWKIPQDLTTRSVDGVKKAATEGFKVLAGGGTALDAVVAAVTVLEDDTAFDAGHGAVLNKKGEVELDAIVVDGKTLQSGGVACVQDIANPVQLARHVMEKTDHCLLAGIGANDFANEMGVPRVSSEELVTPDARAELARYLEYTSAVNDLFHTRAEPPKVQGCDTVGAVALDKDGNLASATSTGGITAKRAGRVGDSPVIGAGAYADNNSCAASSTGHGESIMKTCLLRRVAEHVERGCSAKEAADQALDFMKTRVGGAGGVIVISNTGQVAHSFSSDRMAWADVHGGKMHYGIDLDKEFEDEIAN